MSKKTLEEAVQEALAPKEPQQLPKGGRAPAK